MKILVDSGSTKADWIVYETNDSNPISVSSLGLNPEVITIEEFEHRVDQLIEVNRNRELVKSLYFYGAGCGTPRAKQIVFDFFKSYFVNIEELCVMEDTYAAVYATTSPGESAIVCINGTGSNCSYFDGVAVHQRVQSLGYIAMDDCSGSAFGRLMIKGYYLKSMPEDLRILFAQKYDLDADVIKNHFYKMENPNAYLASFLPFLLTYKEHPYFVELITEQIQFFIDYYIKQNPEYSKVPVHFIGSVAYFLQDLFKDKLAVNGLQVGVFYQKPLDGLKEYHKNKSATRH